MNDKAAREGGSDGLMRSHRLNAVVRLQTQVDVRETPKDGNGSDESIIPHFFFLGRFFAVFADSLKALAVGAPLLPGLRIVSPLPALILRFLAAILE